MSKLEILKKIQPFPLKFNKIAYEGSKDLCLVYSVWSHTAYVNALFYSILSQLCYTDIQKYNIVVFVDRYLETYAKAILGNLIPKENIIPIEGKDCAKHVVATNSLLLNYKTIVISDADNFLVSTEKMDIYEKIHKDTHETGIPRFNFLKGCSAKSTFLERRNILGEFQSEEQFQEAYKPLVNSFEENDNWYLSGMMSYPSHIIPLFKETVNKFKPYNVFCDETIWLQFLRVDFKGSYTIHTFDRNGFIFVPSHNMRETKSKIDDIMYLVHPFLGNVEDELQIPFLFNIAEEFSINLRDGRIKLQNKG